MGWLGEALEELRPPSRPQSEPKIANIPADG
jgi:hypothetical protein